MGRQGGPNLQTGVNEFDSPDDVPLTIQVSGESQPRFIVDLGNATDTAEVRAGNGTAAPIAIPTVLKAPYQRIAVDSTQQVTEANRLYGCTAHSITVTLASSMLGEGNWVVFTDESGGAGGVGQAITIDTEGAATINGAASLSLNANFESAILYSDGTNWFVEAATGSVL